MCGIAGSIGSFPRFDVAASLDRLAHRGPDGRDIVTIDGATHGHVRLALVDLSSASAQPFRYRSQVLSYTGEIWNYRELRQDLTALGHEFRTSGDTEVIAASLSEWGLAALPRLDGMFAFAWSDGLGGHYLARDCFGKVPLYAARSGKAFAWATERKAFSPGVICSAIPPGSTLDLRSGLVSRWYSLPRSPAKVDIISSLREGVRKRLDADAPVCVLISGGLDSALVLALAHSISRSPIVAYTAVLNPRSSDLAAARSLCNRLGISLIEVRIAAPTAETLSAAARSIEIASKVQIEIAALCIPLARRIAADGFKACLSGEAADELFGGYGNMCIKASKLDSAGWRQLRIAQVAKMGRGNFVRCNKAFFAAGVECRLPFMEQSLVESVLSLSKSECPPGKKLLKSSASVILPASIIRRPKETFQGGCGMDLMAAAILPDPAAFYRAEIRKAYSCLAME